MRDALYRGPPIASQYSWNETRYLVGVSAPASHRTPVTVATRAGRRSKSLMSINGSVWIGRIGIDTGPFFADSVSKKIGRPTWPYVWHTYERLSLSTPAIGPITSRFGWT